jgi:hypothetical protein
LVIVEIDVDAVSIVAETRQSPCPSGERLRRIPTAIVAERSVPANVDMRSGDFPWRGRILMVRNAKRALVVTQEFEDVSCIPTRVTKFEHVGTLLAETFEKRR